MKAKPREEHRAPSFKTRRVYVQVKTADAENVILLNTQSFQVPDTTKLVREILRVIGNESPDYDSPLRERNK